MFMNAYKDSGRSRVIGRGAILLAALLCLLHTNAAWAWGPIYQLSTQVSQLTFGTMVATAGTDIISTTGAQSGTGTYAYGALSAGDYTVKCIGSTGCSLPMTISIASTSLC